MVSPEGRSTFHRKISISSCFNCFTYINVNSSSGQIRSDDCISNIPCDNKSMPAIKYPFHTILLYYHNNLEQEHIRGSGKESVVSVLWCANTL